MFGEEKDKGFIILPCELIDYNGEKLKEIVFKYVKLWNLEKKFEEWLEESNIWCSTLVDRIVTGYPFDEKEELEKELGYEDKFMVTGEYFYLFVIQGPEEILKKELKLDKVDLNIKIVEDLKPYKMRKVGILNGAHTAMVPVSYLYGIDTVKETLDDEVLEKFIKDAIYDEIIPALNMDKSELLEFAEAVINRFKNPYVKHFLISISLNSMTKYKTRILPQLITYYEKYKKLPNKLVFALASLIRFYKGTRNSEKIELKDDEWVLDLYERLWFEFDETEKGYHTIVDEILSLTKHWEKNLLEIEGLKEEVVKYLELIDKKGMKEALKEVV
jgi:tagaturonate reductase